MIEVRDLVKKYGSNTAVRGISFNIEKGKIYGLLGPNGAGKSTTMNIMTGCLSATSGSVKVDGFDIFEQPAEAKKRIGYLPEIPPLYIDMTPKEYLNFVAEAKGVPASKRDRQVGEVLELTGTDGVKDRLIRNLSKGFRQRVGIAQAMIGDPEIIILDEPTVGLDPKQIKEIRELIRDLAQVKTVVLSSHILAEVAEVCDHVLIISNGRLVADSELADLEEEAGRSNGLTVRARGSAADVKALLESVAGPGSVSVTGSSDGITEAVVKSGAGREAEGAFRDKVFFAFSSAGIPIREMYHRESSLESIFLELTEKDIYGGAEEDDGDVIPGVPDGDSAYGGTAAGAAPEKPSGKKKKSAGGSGDYTPLFGGGEGEDEEDKGKGDDD